MTSLMDDFYSYILISPFLSSSPIYISLSLSSSFSLYSSRSLMFLPSSFLPLTPSFFHFFRSQRCLELTRPSSSLTQNGWFFGEEDGWDQKNDGRRGMCIQLITWYAKRSRTPDIYFTQSIAHYSSSDYELEFRFLFSNFYFCLLSLIISISMYWLAAENYYVDYCMYHS